MIIALYCVAAAMVLGGIYSAFAGWEIVILERGWTQVLSGVIVATGGVILAGIAFLASALRKLASSLRAQAGSGMPATPPAESALARSGSARSRLTEGTSAGAPLTGATAMALAGLDKAKGAFAGRGDKGDTTDKGEAAEAQALPDPQLPQTALAQAEAEAEKTPETEPQPSPADDFLTRAAEAEAREAEAREAEVPDATDPFAPQSFPESNIGDGALRDDPLADRPDSGDGLRNAVADALFAEDLQPAATPHEHVGAEPPAQFPPANTVPPAPDARKPLSAAPEVSEPVTVEKHSSEKPAAALPDDEEVDRPALSADMTDAPDEKAAQNLQAGQAVSHEAAVSLEQERFATLLEAQTATEEPEYAPTLPEPEPEIIPEPDRLPAAIESEPEPAPQPQPKHEPEPEPVPAHEPEPAPILEPEEAAPAPELNVIGTYESGGNTYTMYADGSIDAKTPEGDYHFASLDELKTFIAEGGESRGS
ncbi:hypothetical protein [Saliniramus sp.]|uniref:hypothetical protein n=1 Tax=Saliniramus sp. TaxID=2986772 RepID=UPI002BFE74F9|nr:hypothetical protein [Saliniramus sp.]HMB10826.1 hypothetical protein [Saliniramus sp.]